MGRRLLIFNTITTTTSPLAAMFSTLAVLLVLPAVALGLNCTAVGDGDYEIGCKTFTTCRDGLAEVRECLNSTVYNSLTSECDQPENVPPPCGQMVDCSTKDNGRYADEDNNCDSFHTCQFGNFLGHQFCPTGLKFSNEKQGCRWPATVEEPCGTKPARRRRR